MFLHHRLFLLISVSLIFTSAGVLASNLNELQADLDAKLSAHRAQQTYMNDFIKRVSHLEGEVRRLEISVVNRKAAMDAAQEKLVSVQQLILSHPEISDARERSQYADAKKLYDESQRELAKALGDQARAQQELQTEKTVSNNIENEINSLRQRIANVHFAILKVEIEREREVVAHGETSCGIMSIQMCMEAALDQARRNAAETGSAVIIDSFTEVRDFELKRDEIQSRVRAIVLRHDVIDRGFIGHSGYYYKIRAIVKGQVPPEFTQIVVTPSFREPARTDTIPSLTVAPQPSAVGIPVPAEISREYRLTVHTNPSDALVRIMNIVPLYKPGIVLAPGSYHIEVTRSGYQTSNQWVEIRDTDKTVSITLSPLTASVPPPAPVPKVAAQAAIPPNIIELIKQLQSTTPAEVRTAARTAYRSKLFHPELLKVVDSLLRKGYNTNLRDGTHEDAMAWLCRVIGAAQARQYKDTLEMVAENADSRKIRTWAVRELRNL